MMKHIISLAHIEITTMIEQDTTMKAEDTIQVDAVHVVAAVVETIVQILVASYGA